MAVIRQTKRDRESAIKKKHIYQTAVMLFKEYGYDKTTMSDICEASGMSKGSIYHFFSKKIDLIYYFFEELSQYALDNLAINDKNLNNPALAILNHCIAVSNAYEQIGYDMSVQMQNVYREDNLHENNQRLNFVQNITKFITAAQKKGTFDSGIDAVEAAHFIHVASAGIFRKWIIDYGAYSLSDANRWYLPPIINMFVAEERRIDQAPCPDRFRQCS